MGEREAARRELEALKVALARILQEENPLPPDEQQARDEELSRRLGFDGSSSPSRDLDSRDLIIISRLLHQVRLMERDNCYSVSDKSVKLEVEASCNGSVANDKHVVETMVQVANAAAEAAKAAAASSGKILEITETVLSNSETAISHELTPSGTTNKGRKSHKEDYARVLSNSDKNLVKKIGRQNQITHWILGFMIVTTFVWRFKLVKMILGVRNSFSNPLQTLGDMVAGSFKGGNDNKEEESPPNGKHKPRGVLPLILGGEEKEVKVQKNEKSTTVDNKVGEALSTSMENIFNVGKPNNEIDKGDKLK